MDQTPRQERMGAMSCYVVTHVMVIAGLLLWSNGLTQLLENRQFGFPVLFFAMIVLSAILYLRVALSSPGYVVDSAIQLTRVGSAKDELSDNGRHRDGVSSSSHAGFTAVPVFNSDDDVLDGDDDGMEQERGSSTHERRQPRTPTQRRTTSDHTDSSSSADSSSSSSSSSSSASSASALSLPPAASDSVSSASPTATSASFSSASSSPSSSLSTSASAAGAARPRSHAYFHGHSHSHSHDDVDEFNEEDGELKHCRVCQFIRPLRAKHCYQCRQCVIKFDHHCPFLGNCVGAHNHQRFWWFLFIQSLTTAMAFLIHLTSFSKGLSNTDWGLRAALSVVLAMCNLMVWSLWGFHTFLALTNQTTYEFIKREAAIRRSSRAAGGAHYSRVNSSSSSTATTPSYDSGVCGPNPYNLGVCTNVAHFCVGRIDRKYCVARSSEHGDPDSDSANHPRSGNDALV